MSSEPQALLSLPALSNPSACLSLLKSALSVASCAPTPSTVVGWVALLQPLAQQPSNVWKKHQDTLSYLLSRVLNLQSSETIERSHHAWPQRLQKANHDLALYDAEFFAALLVELGANPWWDVSPKHPLGTALPAAMGQLSTGLCERLWSIETQRPALLSLQEARPQKTKKSLRNWLDWASEHPQGDDLVRWLLKTGVRSAKGNHALSFASTLDTFSAYQDLGCLPKHAGEQQKVATAWESRLSKGDVSATVVNQMKKALAAATTFKPAEKNSAALSLIQTALSQSSWGRLEREKSPKRHTPEELVLRAEIVRGTHAGNWSLLAAVMLREVRPGWTHSVGHTSLNYLLEGPLNPEYREYSSDLRHDWRALKGTLTAAKDFDWQPGISINGPLAISLIAYLDEDPSQIKALCGALGIERFADFWRDNVVHATAFSQVIGERLNSANDRLCTIWYILAAQHKDLLGDNEKAALHLLRMYQRFHTSYVAESNVDALLNPNNGNQVVYVVEGKEYKQNGSLIHAATLATLRNKPLTMDWLVELVLWEGPGQGPWTTRMDQMAAENLLEKRHLERMKTHIQSSLKRAAKEDQSQNRIHQKAVDALQPWADKFSRQVSSWELASTLPKASKVARKRF